MPTARDRYVELLADGEQLDFKAGWLGRWIADRLTDAELRELLREYTDIWQIGGSDGSTNPAADASRGGRAG